LDFGKFFLLLTQSVNNSLENNVNRFVVNIQ
jgi:hypothetical protein